MECHSSQPSSASSSQVHNCTSISSKYLSTYLHISTEEKKILVRFKYNKQANRKIMMMMMMLDDEEVEVEVKNEQQHKKNIIKITVILV